jgi:hypothetical protein
MGKEFVARVPRNPRGTLRRAEEALPGAGIRDRAIV